MENGVIISKLDAFIRKYYKNQLIRGGIYTVSALLVLFLLMVILEYFGYFSTLVRTVFFWFYAVFFLFCLVRFVAIPLAKMHRIGRCISYEQAAVIIGRHFPEVSDKLLNLLQLQEMAKSGNSELLLAGIEQKTQALSPIPFHAAVNLKNNRKYLKYALIPLTIIVLLLIVFPSVIRDSSQRIINYSVFYEKPAPFSYKINSDSLQVLQYQDFDLQVEVVGRSVPDEVSVVVGGIARKMQKVAKTTFAYKFANVQKSQNFHFEAAGVSSQEFELQMIPKPALQNFTLHLSYPAYTQKQPETLSNIGDFSVPEGTVAKWVFKTKNVGSMFFVADSLSKPLDREGNGIFSKSCRLMRSFSYGIFTSNEFVKNSDTIFYTVSVIPDLSPLIAVSEVRDSMLNDKVLFRGQIKDDYGFSKLVFSFSKTNSSDNSRKISKLYEIPLPKGINSYDFYYSLNLKDLEISAGDEIEYYFEVWDNDGVHGPKSAKSQIFKIEVPTEQEIQNQIDKNISDIERDNGQSISEIQKTQQEITDLMRKLLDKKELTWQDRKQIEELAKKQRQLKENIARMQEQIHRNNMLQEQYREQNEAIMKKQMELERLYDKLMSDEMKEMMDEMEKLLNDVDKKALQESLENMKLKNDDIEKQLDQNLELMKRLEAEKSMENAIKKASDLAEKQRSLSEETEKNAKKDADNILKEQQRLNQEFQNLKNSLDKVQQQLDKLEDSPTLKRDKNLENQIDIKQNEAEGSLRKGKNKNASQQQKSAADDLEKLSEQLSQSMQEMEQEDLAEDVETIRRLLKNIVTLSFNQEDLIKSLNLTLIQDVKYQNIINNQNRIKSDFSAIDDSLRKLAKRQIKVASMISKNVSTVNTNITSSLRDLLRMNQSFYKNNRNTTASKSMQYTVTSLNNLALLLAESLDNMQAQMRKDNSRKKMGSCKKSGSCDKPSQGSSGKKPSPKTMKQLQDALNKQMEALKKQMEGKNSNKGQKLGSQYSEQFARMAAQQEQIRRMMQKFAEELKQQSGGKSGKELDDILNKMEQTETELVNKTITGQTILRQQQIMTRLLEHEKAQMQREKEERRESTEATEFQQISKPDLEKYNKLKNKEIQILQTPPPSFTDYYRQKVNEYFYGTK